jgi:Flp pilus assembly pilin Flp
MSISKFNKRISGKKQLGQGMTEYIIIVALVAIGAIGVYNLFGKTVRDQTTAMAYGLAGDRANNSRTEADTAQGLSNFGQNAQNQ